MRSSILRGLSLFLCLFFVFSLCSVDAWAVIDPGNNDILGDLEDNESAVDHDLEYGIPFVDPDPVMMLAASATSTDPFYMQVFRSGDPNVLLGSYSGNIGSFCTFVPVSGKTMPVSGFTGSVNFSNGVDFVVPGMTKTKVVLTLKFRADHPANNVTYPWTIEEAKAYNASGGTSLISKESAVNWARGYDTNTLTLTYTYVNATSNDFTADNLMLTGGLEFIHSASSPVSFCFDSIVVSKVGDVDPVEQNTSQQVEEQKKTNGLLATIWDAIMSVPTAIFNLIKGLIIPEDGLFGSIISAVEERGEHLGFLMYPFVVVNDLITRLQSTAADGVIRWPGFKVGEYELSKAHDVNIGTMLNGVGILPYVKVALRIAIVIGLLYASEKTWKAIVDALRE